MHGPPAVQRQAPPGDPAGQHVASFAPHAPPMHWHAPAMHTARAAVIAVISLLQPGGSTG
ncbi:MAG: hypothetical protein U0Z70_06700 [Thermomicrobiales bacterium]